MANTSKVKFKSYFDYFFASITQLLFFLTYKYELHKNQPLVYMISKNNEILTLWGKNEYKNTKTIEGTTNFKVLLSKYIPKGTKRVETNIALGIAE